MRNLHELPKNLPVPVDDGACKHLSGMRLPGIELRSTEQRSLNLTEISQGPCIMFFYPRTGDPRVPAPEGWDLIPGARGCTPQSCGFRDFHAAFQKLGVAVFGVSSQTTSYQQEFVKRNRIPYELLSDADLALTEALRLPTFRFNEMRLIKRLALFAKSGMIEKVWYPVFPPDKNAETILAWCRDNLRPAP